MASPSQTPITPNCKGVPPARRTPAAAAWVILSRWMWPGMSSLKELAMPMRGRSISWSVRPMALRRERGGYFSRPDFINWLRTPVLLCFALVSLLLPGLGLDIVKLNLFQGQARFGGECDFYMILLFQRQEVFALLVEQEVSHLGGQKGPHLLKRRLSQLDGHLSEET